MPYKKSQNETFDSETGTVFAPLQESGQLIGTLFDMQD